MKLRNDRSIDPQVERELQAIEHALAGEQVEPEFAELAALATAVHGDRPQAAPGFVAQLGERVERGFPLAREDAAEPLRRPLPWRRLRGALLPATAVASSIAIVAVGIASSGVLSGGGSDAGPAVSQRNSKVDQTGRLNKTATPPVTGEGVRSTTDVQGAATDARSIAPQVPGRLAERVHDRKVEGDADLTLAVPVDKVEDAADGVVEITDRYRGFVVSSQVSGGDAANAGAMLRLRIPAAHAQQALADLSKLGHVRQRTQSTQDITGGFVSVKQRLADANRERQNLLRQLAQAGTPNETASVRARLRDVNGRIARLRDQLEDLDNRVNFSSFSVAVQADDRAGKADDGKFTPGDALRDAGDILGATVGAALVALAILIPAALLLGLVWFAAAGARRRMRERTLDGDVPLAPPAEQTSSEPSDR